MSKNEMRVDIAIIGGGASGICSAISAKTTDRSLKVVILEKLARTGKKILASGNGRCNLGNKNISKEYFHGSIKNALEIIDKTTDTEDFFNSLGLLCICDNEGRMYPYSNHSASVLNVLRVKLANLGIDEICEFDVQSVEKMNKGFIIKSEEMTVYAKSVIVASGGYSASQFGTDGKVTEIMRDMGHKITSVAPSLSPLGYKNPKEYKLLAGIRASGKVTAYCNGKKLDSETGEIQFTEKSLSGICIFNLSYLTSIHRKNLTIKLDFMPEKTFQEVLDILFEFKKIYKNSTLEEYLTGIFRKNLGLYIIKKATDRTGSERVSDLTSNEIKSIASQIKTTDIEVLPPDSWKNSQVTSGGIDGNCIDENLQSKVCKGLYFAGEILDVDGKCGGYNLTWAWSSGLWAGKKCAENLRCRNDKSK